MAETASLSGSERAAIFLMSLSEREAAEVMKHMPVAEVQRLGKAMAQLRKVTGKVVNLPFLGGQNAAVSRDMGKARRY